ncbi:hypothetical protein EDD36DRAFT_252645 [Exophiala viscosa]|uniref:Uncharacterized protein n=1 Tax=Exophiala viscosa TaxID=2486360 RepID=A0AAN6IDF7_9EURO|nr:hypothetical protein EDD36DRAFT_252645 [Exophiala viscosa]
MVRYKSQTDCHFFNTNSLILANMTISYSHKMLAAFTNPSITVKFIDCPSSPIPSAKAATRSQPRQLPSQSLTMSLSLPVRSAPLVLSPGFLLLSYEVRQAIYQAIFVQDHPIFLLSFNGRLVSKYPEDVNLAALVLCRQVSEEALQVLYTENYFILHWGNFCYGPPVNQIFSQSLRYLEVDCTVGLEPQLVVVIDPRTVWGYPERIRNLTANLPALGELFFGFDHVGMLLAAALDISMAIPRCTTLLNSPELSLRVWFLRAPHTREKSPQHHALNEVFSRQGSRLIDMLVHRATSPASNVGLMLTASHTPSLRRIVLNGPMIGNLMPKLLQHRCTLGDCGFSIINNGVNPAVSDQTYTGRYVDLVWGYRGPPPGAQRVAEPDMRPWHAQLKDHEKKEVVEMQGYTEPGFPAIADPPITNLAVLWPGWTSAGVSATLLDEAFTRIV